MDFMEISDSDDDSDDYYDPPVKKKRIYCRHVDFSTNTTMKNFVNDLVNLLCGDLRRTSHRYCTVGPEKQTLFALRHYAGGAFQMVMGDSLHLSRSAVCRAITSVSTALSRRLNDFIQLPTGEDAQQCKRRFYEFAGFPNVISAVDCTHIRIVEPNDHGEQYFNRKKYPSLNVQAACDAGFRFTNVYVKWPRSNHDSFILQQSELWRTMERDGRRGIILGDSAYPCRFWLMTPFSEPSTPAEQHYNRNHSKTRVVIKQAFGLLKQRFNVLHQENRRVLQHVVHDIATCFVLHNYAISPTISTSPTTTSTDHSTPAHHTHHHSDTFPILEYNAGDGL